MRKIIPVVLSGGSGTRLWPLSRKAHPKQFLNICSEKTMFQETLLRLEGANISKPPIIICSHEHRFTVAEQLRDIDIKAGSIILEPVGRNTAPALTIAALAVADQPDAILLILPSDHIISDAPSFHRALSLAEPLATSGKIVAFGVIPTHAETGFGYIEVGSHIKNDCCRITRFVEKPNADLAQTYFEAGNFFWNSGMFMSKASILLEEMRHFRPDIVAACEKALKQAENDLDFTRLDSQAFEQCPSESIDYAIMEHTQHAVVIPLDAGWNDLGSWAALSKIAKKDSSNNTLEGDVLQKSSKNCYLHAEHRLVTAIGLDDIIVIETADAVMVTKPNASQDIKRLVDDLKALGRQESETHRVVYRPWGKYDSLDSGSRYQVKRITVNPGAKLSVQRHQHRSEHWVIVKGKAKVSIDGIEQVLSENQSTYVPAKSIHSLENPFESPLEMIEVQSGTYFGEDDIERLDDIYGRK